MAAKDIKTKNSAAKFISKLPTMRKILATDVEAAYNGDPAAESYGEGIFCYPAIKAISVSNRQIFIDSPRSRRSLLM